MYKQRHYISFNILHVFTFMMYSGIRRKKKVYGARSGKHLHNPEFHQNISFKIHRDFGAKVIWNSFVIWTRLTDSMFMPLTVRQHDYTGKVHRIISNWSTLIWLQTSFLTFSLVSEISLVTIVLEQVLTNFRHYQLRF